MDRTFRLIFTVETRTWSASASHEDYYSIHSKDGKKVTFEQETLIEVFDHTKRQVSLSSEGEFSVLLTRVKHELGKAYVRTEQLDAKTGYTEVYDFDNAASQQYPEEHGETNCLCRGAGACIQCNPGMFIRV